MICPITTSAPEDRLFAVMVGQELERLAYNKSIYDLGDPEHAKKLPGNELWNLARAKVAEDLASPVLSPEELN